MNMRPHLLYTMVALTLGACATQPAPPVESEKAARQAVRTPAAPMIEYPPIEPVPAQPVAAAMPPAAAVQPPHTTTAPPSPPPIVASIAPELPIEEQQITLLLADLQRYGGLSSDELRRELATVNQNLARQRTDANRIRLAMLYALSRSTPQDEQRALQLLESVVKTGNGSPGVRQLAAVLQTQIAERMRAVRDEQQKADVAIQKLEALRNMERSLLRERARGGAGPSGAPSGSGAGSGGSGSGTGN